MEVQDDGRGIDLDVVRARAVRDGVMSEAEARSAGAEEVIELVFRPGFTTADSVSELAGRGFGMDIVRTNLAEMGGSVAISTEPGSGTRVMMRAPLTLLTIRALTVKAGGQLLAIPMIGVDGALLVRRAQVRVVDAIEVVPVGDALLPVSALSAVLGLGPGGAWDVSPAVIVGTGHRRRVLVVEDVVGERELTIQALPWNLRHVPGVAGAAVGDSEEVVLVTNVHELVSSSASSSAGVASMPTSAPRQHRILVVDDSVTSRTLVKNILSSAGYEVVMAVNGEEALARLAEVDVDMVITDVDMPRMNGIELTRAIRSTKALERLSVILVTSLSGRTTSAARRTRARTRTS
ncbi:MAG: response regulator [Sandaracinaceae bacterium]|nr:response regulator [Sandaracinaceae bacterium]